MFSFLLVLSVWVCVSCDVLLACFLFRAVDLFVEAVEISRRIHAFKKESEKKRTGKGVTRRRDCS